MLNSGFYLAADELRRYAKKMNEDESQALIRMIQTLQANQMELAAKIDGVEILLANMGSHVGIAPDELVSKLRVAQATCHQKRLQLVEDRNPSIAAELDNRIGHPLIDEELLKKMNIGEPPSDSDA
jgi:hypothetical protein